MLVWSFLVGALIGALLGVLIGSALSPKRRAVEAPAVTRLVPDTDKRVVMAPGAHVHIVDWGDSFDGTGGTLHRWRWMVFAPGHGATKPTVPPTPGIDVPYFLGNEPTAEDAQRAARLWCHVNHHPVERVTVEKKRQA